MPQNSFEQLKMSKKFGELTAQSWVTLLASRASVGDPQISDFFLSVDMSDFCRERHGLYDGH